MGVCVGGNFDCALHIIVVWCSRFGMKTVLV